MRILHVSCSPRGQAAESYELSRKIIGFLLAREPGAVVINRVLTGGALAEIDENYAISQHASADVSQEGSAAHSQKLIQELVSAAFVVIATPMHNFTVPAVLKLWIDHIVRVRRTFNVSRAGKLPLLRDRPVFVAVSSGGRFSGPGARQPDFLTPYLRAILGTIGLHDLNFFCVQGTAFDPDAVAAARAETGRAIEEFFAGFPRDRDPFLVNEHR